MKFEKNLMLLRKRKGLSQEDLAMIVGVSRQTIYTWEGGLNHPNILMLKKIASALDVTTDELLNGYDVGRLPSKMGNLELEYIADHDEVIKYNEVPNWFIPLEVGKEVCWGIYDNGVRDYSYHLTVLNEVNMHKELGFEVLVESYDPDLNKAESYSLVMREKKNRISFIGSIYYKEGVKHITSHYDPEFKRLWGYGENNEGQFMMYDNAQSYDLTYNGKRQKVFKISYFDFDGSDDPNHTYFEVYLNKKLESLYWECYVRDLDSDKKVTIEGRKYGLRDSCITDRLID